LRVPPQAAARTVPVRDTERRTGPVHEAIDRACGAVAVLSHVQNVVERRTTIPILSNVKLAAEAGGRLALTATDMDLSLVAQEEADVGRGGTTTVGAHTLFDIVRKLPDGSAVSVEQDGQAARSRSARAAPSSTCRPCRPTSSRRSARSSWASASACRRRTSRS
jgi:hypothetical protein